MNLLRARQLLPIVLWVFLLLLSLMPARGIASSFILTWNSNTEHDLAGYTLYYGTQSGNYDSVLNVGNVTEYTITGLEPETQYYFALTAYDTEGNESDFSVEVSAVTDPLHRIICGLGEISGGYIDAFHEDYSHEDWLRIGWGSYNSTSGEARIAAGDIDADGRDELIVGFAPVAGDSSIPGGYFELLDDDHSHLGWGRIKWSVYNSANGASWPACGDLDGDGRDEIVMGLGSGGGGYFEVFGYEGGIVNHKGWGRVLWTDYNTANGGTRPACGDLDSDGKDEIVIGLAAGGSGYFEVFGYESGAINHKAWGRVRWTDYNISHGESRPACGDLDGNGSDEIIIGLGSGSGGYFEIFRYDSDIVIHQGWGRIHWADYNTSSGETRPACGDVDDDGADEIVIGMGMGGAGYFELFDYSEGIVTHQDWGRIHWNKYNAANGETWPAVKK